MKCKGIVCSASQLFIQPIFFSTEKDLNSFGDPVTNQIFSSIYEKLKKKNLLSTVSSKNRPDGTQYRPHIEAYSKFQSVFDNINNTTLKVLNENHLPSEKQREFLNAISLTLLKNHLRTIIKFIIWKLLYSFGGPFLSMQFIILYFLAFTQLARKPKNHIPCITFILITTCLINNVVIAISHFMLERYLIYSGISMMILFLILFSSSTIDEEVRP